MSGGARPRGTPRRVLTVASTLGTLLLAFVPFVLVPLLIAAASGEFNASSLRAFLVPAVVSLGAGLILRRVNGSERIGAVDAMLVLVAAWVIYGLLGALPLYLGLQGMKFVDAFLESVSGLTTTGITVLVGLDQLPRFLLFWRAELQFLGGLGILTFFLAVTFRSGEAPFHLFTAESHKIQSPRLTPSVSRSIKLILSIYVGLVALFAVLYMVEGMSWFDGLAHALTSISTGGFSTHDASIGYFASQGYPHYRLIEWTVIAAMLVGGVNFFVHYRLLRGQLTALWDSSEVRAYWSTLLVVVVVILVASAGPAGAVTLGIEERLRVVVFQVSSLLTSTGYATRPLASPIFPLVARPLFLLLMLVGGSVGSTTGGIKQLRIVILFEGVRREIRGLYSPRRAVRPLIVDGQLVPPDELGRVATMFFLWVGLVAITGIITLMFSSAGLLGSFSLAASMLGNMGPTYLAVNVASLPASVKVMHIVGMLAGRLEILPVLLFLSPRAWS